MTSTWPLVLIYPDYIFPSIQFNSKTLFKDGDPVSSQVIFPGAIQTCDQTKQHFTTYTFIQKHIHKHLYNVYTNMYIHHTQSFMHKKEQYIVNNKHVEQECS